MRVKTEKQQYMYHDFNTLAINGINKRILLTTKEFTNNFYLRLNTINSILKTVGL